jgi:mRNA-degrading endonuclease RelE of RelBE toxin-antitoxin system
MHPLRLNWIHPGDLGHRIYIDPFASIPNAKKLQGRPGYRLRIGEWRVIYEINKDEITIIVMKIALRGEVAPQGEVYK